MLVKISSAPEKDEVPQFILQSRVVLLSKSEGTPEAQNATQPRGSLPSVAREAVRRRCEGAGHRGVSSMARLSRTRTSNRVIHVSPRSRTENLRWADSESSFMTSTTLPNRSLRQAGGEPRADPACVIPRSFRGRQDRGGFSLPVRPHPWELRTRRDRNTENTSPTYRSTELSPSAQGTAAPAEARVAAQRDMAEARTWDRGDVVSPHVAHRESAAGEGQSRVCTRSHKAHTLTHVDTGTRTHTHLHTAQGKSHNNRHRTKPGRQG